MDENPYQAPREPDDREIAASQRAQFVLMGFLIWLVLVSPLLAAIYYALGWVSIRFAAAWGAVSLSGAIPAIFWANARRMTRLAGIGACVISVAVLLYFVLF